MKQYIAVIKNKHEGPVASGPASIRRTNTSWICTRTHERFGLTAHKTDQSPTRQQGKQLGYGTQTERFGNSSTKRASSLIGFQTLEPSTEKDLMGTQQVLRKFRGQNQIP